MAKSSAPKSKRRAAKLAARNPRRTGRAALGGAKRTARHPRTTGRAAGLLGRSVRGGTALAAKGKAAKAGGRGGAKLLKAAGRRRPGRARLFGTGALAALGAYLLDPENGKRRRRVLIDKTGKLLRRGEREAERKARYAEGVAEGMAHKAGVGEDRPPAEVRLNDPALARKVESEIFRDREASKGAVNVMAENGVVSLRGQVESETEIGALVTAAQQVEGVRQVENLMHTPGRSAPQKSDGGPGSGAA